MVHTGNPKRYVAIAALAALGVVATSVPAVVLGSAEALLLVLLALREYEPRRRGASSPAGD